MKKLSTIILIGFSLFCSSIVFASPLGNTLKNCGPNDHCRIQIKSTTIACNTKDCKKELMQKAQDFC